MALYFFYIDVKIAGFQANDLKINIRQMSEATLQHGGPLF
jgi:hypothetical protein